MSSFVETLAGHISARSRAKKWAQFLVLMTPSPEDALVDVGVNTIEYSESDNYLERHYAYPENITAVGVESDFSEFHARYPKVKTITSDGTKLPFSDNTFDIACSNAVIEHVGNYEKQLAFLRELYRVGKRGYLTTPNRLFPIEVHTRIPLLHIFLPKTLFDQLLLKIGKGWATGDYMHLLSAKDIRRLCSEAQITDYTLIRNRLFGFTMTFTLVWNKHQQ